MPVRVFVITHPDHQALCDEAASIRRGVMRPTLSPSQTILVYEFPNTDLAYGFEKFICKADPDTTTTCRQEDAQGKQQDPVPPSFRVTITNAGPKLREMLDDLSNDFFGWRDEDPAHTWAASFLFPAREQADGFMECIRELDPLAVVTEVASAS